MSGDAPRAPRYPEWYREACPRACIDPSVVKWAITDGLDEEQHNTGEVYSWPRAWEKAIACGACHTQMDDYRGVYVDERAERELSFTDHEPPIDFDVS